MALTETWLSEHVDAELTVEGYTLFRQDRKRQKKRKGRDSGGVAVYVRDDLAADMVTVASYSNGVIEFLGLYSKTKNLLLLVMYRQPDDIIGGHRSIQIKFKQALSKLEETLSSKNNPVPEVILCGDFNLPHAVREGNKGLGVKKDEKVMTDELLALTDEFFLSQLIQMPTHRKGNTLDLLFSNNPMIIHTCNTVETNLSDHDIIECLTTYNINITKEQSVNLNDSTDDFDNFNFFNENTEWLRIDHELAQQDWEMEFRALNPRQMLSKFLAICKAISSKYAPIRKKDISAHRKSQIPRDRKNLMRKRRRINVQLRKATNEARRNKLKSEAREVEKSS